MRGRRLGRACAAVALMCVFVVSAVPIAARAASWTGTLVPDAVASWWARPQAVYQPSYQITYLSGVSEHGDWVWAAYDHRAGVTTRVPLGRLRHDDHNTPAIIAPVDRPPAVFYTGHDKTDRIYYRVSAQVGDWRPGPEQAIPMPGPVTYVQVHRGRTPDSLLLFTRCVDQWLLIVSEDYGASWTIRPLLGFDEGSYGYLISAQRADGTIRVGVAGHPEKSNMTDVRYLEIDAAGDIRLDDRVANIYSGQGLPLHVQTDLPVIHEFAEGARGRLFDVSTADEPEVLIAEWQGDAEARYAYLRRGADGWAATDLIGAGKPIGYTLAIRYLGGGTFPNPTPGGTFYLSREASGVWSVERWSVRDGVGSAQPIASSRTILARPTAPIGAPSGLPLTWLRLTRYQDYLHYSGSIAGLLPAGRPTSAGRGVPLSADFDGDGADEPVLFRRGIWRVRDAGGTSAFAFGRIGDTPLAGDWDGDGRDEPGVVRGRTWIVADEAGGARRTHRFVFGAAGDVPLAGDWDGDGRDGIGARRGSTWRLRQTATSGAAQVSLPFGRAGDTPLAGDWDGDGADSIAVRRGAAWMLRGGLGSASPVTTFTLGVASDAAIVGDWAGSGLDAPGVRRGPSGVWYVTTTGSGRPEAGWAPHRFRF